MRSATIKTGSLRIMGGYFRISTGASTHAISAQQGVVADLPLFSQNSFLHFSAKGSKVFHSTVSVMDIAIVDFGEGPCSIARSNQRILTTGSIE
jgi:hypothetical protein